MSDARRTLAAWPAILVLGLAACAAGTAPTWSAPAGPTASGARPSSPAVVSIVQPAANATLSGPTVHVELALQGATIVAATTTDIRPDQGHVHLYVDNVLVSMNYGLTQDLSLKPGTYQLKAEFVASDHAPFAPRDWSPVVLFSVK
ncbi:MAG: hypothetical protein ACHQ15_02930 [Candidatus Limnocylindrales bacterium]